MKISYCAIGSQNSRHLTCYNYAAVFTRASVCT